MKNKIIVMTVLCLQAPMVAATTLSEKISDIADNAEVHNGDSSVSRYDMNAFSYKKEINQASAGLNKNGEEESSCQYYVSTVGRRETFKAIANSQTIDDAKTAQALMDIYNKDKRQIQGAFMFAWDGESGDSEYCLRYPTYIYFSNGEKMLLSYDYTD